MQPFDHNQQFNVYCDQTAGWIKMPLGNSRYGGRPWPRRRCVRWGFSPPERGTAPQFSAHIYCGQAAGRMKTPLGTEVNLGPGHSVFDGDPAAAPAKGAQHADPLFSAYVYCGHGRPSQLLRSSCTNGRPKMNWMFVYRV